MKVARKAAWKAVEWVAAKEERWVVGWAAPKAETKDYETAFWSAAEWAAGKAACSGGSKVGQTAAS